MCIYICVYIYIVIPPNLKTWTPSTYTIRACIILISTWSPAVDISKILLGYCLYHRVSQLYLSYTHHIGRTL